MPWLLPQLHVFGLSLLTSGLILRLCEAQTYEAILGTNPNPLCSMVTNGEGYGLISLGPKQGQYNVSFSGVDMVNQVRLFDCVPVWRAPRETTALIGTGGVVCRLTSIMTTTKVRSCDPCLTRLTAVECVPLLLHSLIGYRRLRAASLYGSSVRSGT